LEKSKFLNNAVMHSGFTGNRDLIGKLTEIILSNLENETFGGKELAQEAGLRTSVLNRHVKSLTQKTINQFIREVRLKRAMEILLIEEVTASEVAFKVGFGSPSYFSTCFSEYYGFPPGEVKKRILIENQENGDDYFIKPILRNQDSVQGNKNSAKRKIFSWKVLFFASCGILIIIFLIYVFSSEPSNNSRHAIESRTNKQKKSIAVLPFINDSRDKENVYFINGILEAILDNLSRIRDLEVRPRTSIERYRNNVTKTIPQIARELGVKYIIEGSGQKIGDDVSLYIQLIEAGSDKHLFSQRYNMKLEDIFALQSQVAMKVASEIEAIVTFEERESIEKIPTTNIAALNFFLQANDLHNVAESEGNLELDNKAELLYKKAIQLDSTYADPYTSLGWIVFKRNIDSALYLADRALHFDPENPDAYTLKGLIFHNKGLDKKTEEAFKLSLKFKPNNSLALSYLGEIYFMQGDCSKAVESQLQAFHLENNSMQERNNIKNFCSGLYCLGFYKEGKKYAERLLNLDNDSSYFYWCLALEDLDLGNYPSALRSSLKMYKCDTEDLNNIYQLMSTYIYLRDFKEANLLLNKYLRIKKQQGRKIEPDYLFGFVYLENGKKEEADFHLDGTIRENLKIVEQNQPPALYWAYLTLAKTYSIRNDKSKALYYIQMLKDHMDSTILMVKDFKNCTTFDNIRHEPGFQEFINKAEAKLYQEHEKVAVLLLQKGILDSSSK
jgi:TolB-like protein/AraC-like DNA-binding protein